MRTRIIRREVYRRSFLGQVVRIATYLFNFGVMLFLLNFMATASERAGRVHHAANGNIEDAALTLGVLIILAVWMLGAVFMNLLMMATRGEKTIIEEME